MHVDMSLHSRHIILTPRQPVISLTQGYLHGSENGRVVTIAPGVCYIIWV